MKTWISAFLVLAAGPGIVSAQVDVNGNGISDIYERHFNGGQNFGPTFTASADQDGDGQNNLQESVSGTDPLKFDPPEGHLVQTIRHVPATWGQEPGQSEPVLLTPEAFEIGWQTVAGKEYTLTFSPSLEGGTWLPVDYPIHSYSGGPILLGCIPDAGGGQMPDKFFWRVEARDVDQDGDGLTDYEEILFGTNPETPVTFTGIPDLWLTTHYPSAQDFDPDADDDNDGLTNAGECHHGTSPHSADSDGDGATDGAEVNQGSNATNNSDGGLPPEDPIEEVEFTVGGDYACWRMEIQGQGPRDTRLLRFASPATNFPVARTFKLQRNNKYEITLHRVGGYPDWYCWEAGVAGTPSVETFYYGEAPYSVGERNENARFFSVAGHWLVDNRDGLLTSHLDSYYDDVATGLKAVLHPMEYKLCWETLNKANQVLNKTKKDDDTKNLAVLEKEGDATYAAPRNNLYVVADPADKVKVSLEFGLPEGLPERFIAAAYDANGKVPNSDALFPTTAGQPAAMEIPVAGITDTPREIKIGYDENNNSLLDDTEAIRIPLYKRQSNNDLRHLNVKGISNGKYAEHKQALENKITLWGFQDNERPTLIAPYARSFLSLFYYKGDFETVNEDLLIDFTPGTASLDAFAHGQGFAEWLTHNSGAPFIDGVADIEHFEWRTTSRVSEFFAKRTPFALEGIVDNPQGQGFTEYATATGTTLENFYNSQVKAAAEAALQNAPYETTVTFPQDGTWYEFPDANLFQGTSPQTTPGWVTPATVLVGKDDGDGGFAALRTDFLAGTEEFKDFDALGSIGRGRVLRPRYQFTIRKDNVAVWPFETTVYNVTQVLFDCTVEDLYDFNYEDSELASHAAAMQIGYGKGANGEQRDQGRIYRHRILIRHIYSTPFSQIDDLEPQP